MSSHLKYDATVSTTLRPDRAHATLDVIEDQTRRPFARTDMAFGLVSVIVGLAVSAAGIARPQANIPIYVYGMVLVTLGILLFNAGRRR